MSHHEHEEITREEIKKEFQVERMILFSDAVFAIVITLMAIEIRLPEGTKITAETIPELLHHLFPVVFAYMVSFLFIGSIWYQHLKIFSLLKDYDKGLVIRNLLLLFFIGLFPFTASLLTKANGSMIAVFMYISIILICMLIHYLLYHYIVVQRPQLRFNANIEEHLVELRKRKISLIGFAIAIVLTSITYFLIPREDMKSLSVLWVAVFSYVYHTIIKKMEKKNAKAKKH